jgi:signal transduction histidine kinase
LAAYFTAQTLLQIAISGVGFVLLWDNSPYWNDKSIPVLMSTCIVLALVFLIEFIQKDKIHRITYIGLRALQLLATLLIFGSFTNGFTFNISVWVLYRIIPVFYIGFFVLSSYFFLTKYLPARFFFISFLLSLISIGGIYYYALTKEHNNVFTNQLVIVGEMLKSIILTLALMDRLRIFKEEKEEAQAQVIVQLEEMNSLKENANIELIQKVEEKTIELHQKQTEVKKALIWGEEQERKRVSQELHDGMGSLLSTLRLNAESIDLNDKGLSEKEYFAYQNVIELIDKACTELRNISHNMMPVGIEQFGLVQQLISIIRKINDSEKVHIVLDTFNMEKRLNKDIELSIYRICLELINNIINHANAKTATLQIIRNDDVLSIVMEDDGVGFNIDEIVEGHGLISIRSRVDAFGGKINIDSNNNRGTTIIIELPVEV